MIWQHKSKMHWLCDDLRPFIIEVKTFKSGNAIWRIKNSAGIIMEGKDFHPIEAMKMSIAHAEEMHKLYAPKSQVVKEWADKHGVEVQEAKFSVDIKPEDVTVLPGEPSSSDH